MNVLPCILVIEDSPSQALQLRLLLQRAGYTVVVADDGATGYQQAQQLQPDLILLDIRLPSLDGFGVLAHLKNTSDTAAIPVVMLTTVDTVDDVEHALALGAAGYLFKDDCLFTSAGVDQIAAVVEELLPGDLVHPG